MRNYEKPLVYIRAKDGQIFAKTKPWNTTQLEILFEFKSLLRLMRFAHGWLIGGVLAIWWASAAKSLKGTWVGVW